MRAMWAPPPWGISLLLLNSVYRGGGRWSRGALALQGGGFPPQMGMWSGADVGHCPLRCNIPPATTTPKLRNSSDDWCRFRGMIGRER